jgi:transcription initiation factor TFIIIB Brf1 subunit/transcription initiation factor TFIIB
MGDIVETVQITCIKIFARCPYCGETKKRKYSVCRNCGEILHHENYDIAKEKTRPKQMEMEN